MSECKQAVRENFQEIPNMISLVCLLKSLGYELVLISDHALEWIDYCDDKYELKSLFQIRQFSFEIGICKNNVKAYEKILNSLNGRVDECLFIDDNQKNIKTAQSLGLETIRFNIVFTKKRLRSAEIYLLIQNYQAFNQRIFKGISADRKRFFLKTMLNH
jgi:FMN phosphatase YigB (HAD superfamily)